MARKDEDNQEIRIKRARVALILKEPFFGTLAMHLEIMPCPDRKYGIYSAATDGRRLFYSPEWFKKLTDGEIKGVVLHEVLHAALGHCAGRQGSRIHDVWNIAIDYAANAIIHSTMETPTGRDIAMPNPHLYAKEYKNKCAEEIYDDLMKNAVIIEGMCTLDQHLDGRGQGQDGDGGGGGKGTGEGLGKPGESAGQGRLPPYKPGDNDWPSILAAAADAARAQGKLPAGMERIVDETLNPRIPWRQVLAEFIANINKHDYDMRRPNRRHIHNGIYLPSIRGEELTLVIGIDTSGSISDDELAQFIAEVNGIMACIKGWTLHVMGCDAAVHGYEVVQYPETLDFKQVCKGRGGTSFVPVFDKVAEEGLTPACLIYLTDTFGDFPDEEPGYPVLWIINNTEGKVPWGRSARLTDV
jgi:predicted metal-dependent peptidase